MAATASTFKLLLLPAHHQSTPRRNIRKFNSLRERKPQHNTDPYKGTTSGCNNNMTTLCLVVDKGLHLLQILLEVDTERCNLVCQDDSIDSCLELPLGIVLPEFCQVAIQILPSQNTGILHHPLVCL